jgi:arylsulfatase
MSALQHHGEARDGAAAAGNGSSGLAGRVAPVMRGVLPIPDPLHVGLTTYDARDPNTKYPPITMLRPPPGAPNVLIVLIDDVGFAASSAFGGPCNTPVAERLAAGGVKLNRFPHHRVVLADPAGDADRA